MGLKTVGGAPVKKSELSVAQTTGLKFPQRRAPSKLPAMLIVHLYTYLGGGLKEILKAKEVSLWLDAAQAMSGILYTLDGDALTIKTGKKRPVPNDEEIQRFVNRYLIKKLNHPRLAVVGIGSKVCQILRKAGIEHIYVPYPEDDHDSIAIVNQLVTYIKSK